ncbi:ClpXP protease specificity-enhancing factor SspB [Myxococcota bacterium]|jgi:stringent starvation protein B|nr:ClpXP protease specificity-enhancing factor SspB [Myxococcota bacterium]
MNAKRDCLEKLLAEGLVFVQLDPRVPGVDLPAHLRRQPVVGLNLSLNFRIDVFEIDDVGVRASLSFQGQRHLCVLPFDAIFLMGLAEGDGTYVFPESAPPELRARFAAAMAQAEAGAAAASPAPTPAAGDAGREDDEADEADDEPPPPPPPRGRPQLRLVK